MTYHLRSLDKKFIRCSVRVLVAHLTAIIKQKLDIPPDLKVRKMFYFCFKLFIVLSELQIRGGIADN